MEGGNPSSKNTTTLHRCCIACHTIQSSANTVMVYVGQCSLAGLSKSVVALCESRSKWRELGYNDSWSASEWSDRDLGANQRSPEGVCDNGRLNAKIEL